MKKSLIVLVLALASAGSLFAGGVHDLITVEGKLAVNDAVPAIVANGKTWVLPAGPFYQIAWENGIKVGDSVKAEGFEMNPFDRSGDMDKKAGKADKPDQMERNGKNAKPAAAGMAPAGMLPADTAVTADVTMFMPTRVWVNGKEIDLSTVRKGPRFGRGMMPDCGNGPANGPGNAGERGPGPDRK